MRRFLRRAVVTASLVGCFVTTLAGPAHADTIWIREYGTSVNDLAWDVVMADASTFYVVGTRNIGVNANVGVVRKYDANGNLLWARDLADRASVNFYGGTVDGAGNLYVAGGSGTTDNTRRALLAKYSPSGTLLWTRQYFTTHLGWFLDVALGPGGTIYATGGLGLYPTSIPVDAITAKTQSTGELVWADRIQSGGDSSKDDFGRGLAVDTTGAAYVAGTTWVGGVREGFVVKYDTNKNRLWFALVGGVGRHNDATDLSYDGAQGIYVSGWVSGYLTGASSINGGIDAYVRKYRPNGSWEWTHQFGSNTTDEALAVTAYPDGRVYVAGNTFGTLPNQPSAGGLDAFVRYMNSAGGVIDTDQFGTSAFDAAHAIAADAGGNVYSTGRTQGAFPGYTYQGGFNDAFVGKFFLRACTFLEILLGTCRA